MDKNHNYWKSSEGRINRLLNRKNDSSIQRSMIFNLSSSCTSFSGAPSDPAAGGGGPTSESPATRHRGGQVVGGRGAGV